MKVLILKPKITCKSEKTSEIYNNFVRQVRANGIAIIPSGFDYVVEDIDATKFKDDVVYLEGGVAPIIF